MAENGQMMDIVNPQEVSRRTLILATLAGIAVEGPLLGMMGFSFLTSLIILVVTSPLLLIFSPLLFGAACIFAFAIAGFGVAGTMAFAGLSSFVLVYRSLIKGVRKTGIDYGDTDHEPVVSVDKMIQPDETVAKEQQQLDAEVAGTRCGFKFDRFNIYILITKFLYFLVHHFILVEVLVNFHVYTSPFQFQFL